MKRSTMTAIGCALAGVILAHALVDSDGDNTASSEATPQVVACDGPGGQASDVLYYLMPASDADLTIRNEYIDTGSSGIVFDDGTGPHKRVIHEYRAPIVRAVCEADRATFEQAHGIQVGPQIQGELFELVDAADGSRQGTVFVDQGERGVRATGGGLAVQQTYARGAISECALQNVSLFGPAFDASAIDKAKPAKIEREYIGPARARLADAAAAHLAQEGYTPISFAEYSTLIGTGMECEIHYDQGD